MASLPAGWLVRGAARGGGGRRPWDKCDGRARPAEASRSAYLHRADSTLQPGACAEGDDGHALAITGAASRPTCSASWGHTTASGGWHLRQTLSSVGVWHMESLLVCVGTAGPEAAQWVENTLLGA